MNPMEMSNIETQSFIQTLFDGSHWRRWRIVKGVTAAIQYSTER